MRDTHACTCRNGSSSPGVFIMAATSTLRCCKWRHNQKSTLSRKSVRCSVYGICRALPPSPLTPRAGRSKGAGAQTTRRRSFEIHSDVLHTTRSFPHAVQICDLPFSQERRPNRRLRLKHGSGDASPSASGLFRRGSLCRVAAKICNYLADAPNPMWRGSRFGLLHTIARSVRYHTA
jgi:hypothetical protein